MLQEKHILIGKQIKKPSSFMRQKQSNILNAISKMFFRAWLADLLQNKAIAIQEEHSRMDFSRDGQMTVPDLTESIIEHAGDEYKAMLSEELNLNRLLGKLRFKDTLEMEFRCIYTGWTRLHIMVVERDAHDDNVVSVLFGWQEINEEKWKERKYKQELEKANSELVKALAKAEQASHAKSDFLSRMSHDMRTPMNGIIGMTDIALKCLNDPARLQDALEKIRSSSNQLCMLVNDVLDMSKIESGRIQLVHEPVNLQKLVENMLPNIKAVAQKYEVSIIYKGFLAEHSCVYGSQVHLQRVIANIMSNAVKYNRAGGSVELEIREEVTDTLTGKADFVVRVQDTGIGMSKDFVEHKLFAAFSRENPNSKVSGTGLGMAIVKEIVQLMQGDIQTESKQGVGTVFKIRLPLEPAPALEEKELPHPLSYDAKALVNRRILLVDDNEVNLEIAVFLLENHGASCVTAHNGKEGVDLFRRYGAGFFDLILMDVRMPVMNGLEAARLIRSCYQSDAKDIPIIAMTANAFSDDKRKCSEAGMNDHISKPLDVRLMLQTLEKYI